MKAYFAPKVILLPFHPPFLNEDYQSKKDTLLDEF